MSPGGFVFIQESEAGSRNLEYYAEEESSAAFHSGSWPVTIECKRGKATLTFTGEQFYWLPVLVEFSKETRFGLPPEADCRLTVAPRTTLNFALFDLAEGAHKHAVSFEPVSEVLLKLAKHNALEPLPNLKAKGLRLDLRSNR